MLLSLVLLACVAGNAACIPGPQGKYPWLRVSWLRRIPPCGSPTLWPMMLSGRALVFYLLQ